MCFFSFFLPRTEREKEKLLRSEVTKLKDKKSANNWFILNNSLKIAVAMGSQYVRFQGKL